MSEGCGDVVPLGLGCAGETQGFWPRRVCILDTSVERRVLNHGAEQMSWWYLCSEESGRRLLGDDAGYKQGLFWSSRRVLRIAGGVVSHNSPWNEVVDLDVSQDAHPAFRGNRTSGGMRKQEPSVDYEASNLPTVSETRGSLVHQVAKNAAVPTRIISPG
ncbi:hypothetical protein E5D57_007768 [Metarhizium anisopliae]|nr:hypothetical protein E5D57_007768 [Metarhizium anisopliae]